MYKTRLVIEVAYNATTLKTSNILKTVVVLHQTRYCLLQYQIRTSQICIWVPMNDVYRGTLKSRFHRQGYTGYA